MSRETARISELEEQGFWVVRLDQMKPLIGDGKSHLPFPDSTEPLYWIGRHYQALREFHTAQLFFARGLRVPPPASNKLFVDRAIHDYLLRLEYAVTCYYTGDHAEAIASNEILLQGNVLPANLVEQVKRNRQFSLDTLTLTVPSEPVQTLPIMVDVSRAR